MRLKITLFGILPVIMLLLASGIASNAEAAVIGIDVSKYQGTIDWDTAQHSFNFAFIKAGGADAGFYQDPQFTRNREEARRLGIARGYYFFAGGGDPVQEADYFYSIVGQLQPGEAIALDFEVDHPYPIGWVQAFMTRTDQLFGVKALFYTYMKRVWSYDWSPVANDGHPLWGAIYDDSYSQPAPGPFPGLLIKQFTSSGSVPGIGTAVDVNVYNDNFSFDWFHDIGYVPAPPPPPPAPAPSPTGPAQRHRADSSPRTDGTVADNGSAGNVSQNNNGSLGSSDNLGSSDSLGNGDNLGDSDNPGSGSQANSGNPGDSGSQDSTSPDSEQASWFGTLFVNPALTGGSVDTSNTNGQVPSSLGNEDEAAGDGTGTTVTSGAGSGSAQGGDASGAQGSASGAKRGSADAGTASGAAASSTANGTGNGPGATTTGTDISRTKIPSWNLSQTPPLDKVDQVAPGPFDWITNPLNQEPQKSMTAPPLLPKQSPLLTPAT